jgi:excisionase family DNA binding protein
VTLSNELLEAMTPWLGDMPAPAPKPDPAAQQPAVRVSRPAAMALPPGLADQPPYPTARQVAKLLCVSVYVVYQAVRLGDLPAIRWGKRVVIDRSDLAEFVAA